MEVTQGSAWAHWSANVDPITDLGEKSSCCSPAAVSGKPPWLLVGADGHPSEQTTFLLHVRYLSVIIIGTGVHDSPLFV